MSEKRISFMSCTYLSIKHTFIENKLVSFSLWPINDFNTREKECKPYVSGVASFALYLFLLIACSNRKNSPISMPTAHQKVWSKTSVKANQLDFAGSNLLNHRSGLTLVKVKPGDTK